MGAKTGREVPQEASHNVLEQSDCLHFNKSSDHIAQHCANSVKAFICRTDIAKTGVVEKNLLYNEDRNGL